jgi:predicted ATPase
MKIKSLNIKNFKSIVDLELIEPNPFTVFVGPNGAGKSNIFEALEFFSVGHIYFSSEIVSWFGGSAEIFNRSNREEKVSVTVDFGVVHTLNCSISNTKPHITRSSGLYFAPITDSLPQEIIRIFIKNKDIQKINFQDSSRLSLSCDNLEKVLKRILQDEGKKEEILEWLELLIPEFQHIEIDSDNKLKIREKYSNEPFDKSLISNGTYNILALLTAVYQSDEPQFLCIEEPENGLNPKVMKALVDFFRDACEDKGHYIWLNTHSQTLVSQLTPEEIVLVNKKQGQTVVKQLKGENLFGLQMDEAWLTGALGGGLPW